MAEAFGITCHELVNLDFRCGSTTDSNSCTHLRLLLGVKRTKLGPKRTLPHEGRLEPPRQITFSPAPPRTRPSCSPAPTYRTAKHAETDNATVGFGGYMADFRYF